MTSEVKKEEVKKEETKIVIKKRQYPIAEDLAIQSEEQYLIDKLRAKFKLATSDLSDVRILQFVRGYCHHDNPEQKAMEMLEKCVLWREKEKVTSYLHTRITYRDDLCSLWPEGIHGFDKYGHPIYVERVGMIYPDALKKSEMDIAKITKVHIQNMERIAEVAARHSRLTGKQRYKYVVIMDAEGGGLRFLGSAFREPMKKLIDIDQTCYPETLLKMYILNCPFSLSALWTFASPFIDSQTKKRIIWGMGDLKKDIDESQLPQFLGGKCKCKDGKCLHVPFVSGNSNEKSQEFIFEETEAKTNTSSTSTSSSTTATSSASTSSSTASSSS
eukprot:TRINITY_DN4194_c0_g1_i2.p1 TRINITY_DN4194_c0_g1~~TRINITY_DN4194_c0_g1_i2.p1  ORF type:complete len:330 (+),score=90.46 TRINITY_DN4194_c0_g1_i2:72-1061(+)